MALGRSPARISAPAGGAVSSAAPPSSEVRISSACSPGASASSRAAGATGSRRCALLEPGGSAERPDQATSAAIEVYDQQIMALAEKYPQAGVLRQVKGVGLLTSACHVLTIGDPGRFKDSRQVAAYLLDPGSAPVGCERSPARITKSGDSMMRTLLVESAKYILRRASPVRFERREAYDLSGPPQRLQRPAGRTPTCSEPARPLHPDCGWKRGGGAPRPCQADKKGVDYPRPSHGGHAGGAPLEPVRSRVSYPSIS